MSRFASQSWCRGSGAFLRKLRSKGVRGVLESLACRSFPYRERLAERWLEWRLGIDTRGEIDPEALGITSPGCNGYMPTFYLSNLALLRAADVSPGDVFVDYGSGKGRVIMLAARWPFARVIGVEFSETLNSIARENVRRAEGRLRCRSVELVTTDARHFAVPSDATMFYFANPFYGHVLDVVLENIRASLVQHPRAIKVISHSHAPTQTFERQMRTCNWLELAREVPLQCWTHAWIYRNRRAA